MSHPTPDPSDFAAPDPFVVADVRLALLAHTNRLNASDKVRERTAERLALADARDAVS